MSSKVANLIAVELGVLIAIMAWLAFSNLRSVQTPAIARQPTRLVDSFANVAPMRKARPRLPAPVDYRADLAPETQPEEEQLRQAAPIYEEAIATEPSLDSGLDAGYITATSPAYAVVEPQPLLASPDCYYPPVNQYLVYPRSTAFVVVSNSQSFHRRPRAPHRPRWRAPADDTPASAGRRSGLAAAAAPLHLAQKLVCKLPARKQIPGLAKFLRPARKTTDKKLMKIIHFASAALLGVGFTFSAGAQQPDPALTTTTTAAAASPAANPAASPAATVAPKISKQMERWEKKREHRQEHRRRSSGNNRDGTRADQQAEREANREERRQMRRGQRGDRGERGDRTDVQTKSQEKTKATPSPTPASE